MHHAPACSVGAASAEQAQAVKDTTEVMELETVVRVEAAQEKSAQTLQIQTAVAMAALVRLHLSLELPHSMQEAVEEEGFQVLLDKAVMAEVAEEVDKLAQHLPPAV